MEHELHTGELPADLTPFRIDRNDGIERVANAGETLTRFGELEVVAYGGRNIDPVVARQPLHHFEHGVLARHHLGEQRVEVDDENFLAHLTGRLLDDGKSGV